ncbi:DoxX family membrane protein [Spelaeicoccus albus]|uniref:Putative membrane protein YphA (DoxX/SURF4 family) n=1 Tax=Spelaeicoccus albus TaxID=1280376 RepID=A0A7Z0II79_9MICO|nr:DoxX family membrane protein [Spelaeicoccus albus]NYI68122.1 putative membrane protein YphA (DoxX/SURF4 family) [Spelaeicoccus albus]
MSIVRRLARPLLSAAFISGGVDKIRHPHERAERLAPVLDKIGDRVGDNFPSVEPTLVVRAAGGAEIGAGVLLAAGILPRFASTVLVATSTVDAAGTPIWKIRDKEERKRALSRLVTNMSLLGGALLASVDTAGKPGLAWRAQHATDSARKLAEHQTKSWQKQAAKSAKKARSKAEDVLGG